MGIFSIVKGLLKIPVVGGIAGGLLTEVVASLTEQPAAPAKSAAAAKLTSQQQQGQIAAPTAKFIEQGAGAATPGKNKVITRIMTINPAGKIIKQVDKDGRPFLMAKDLVIAKRVFRSIAKMHSKLPRRSTRRRGKKSDDDVVVINSPQILDRNGNIIVRT